LIKEEGNEDRNQHHPEDGKSIGNGKDPGGHQRGSLGPRTIDFLPLAIVHYNWELDR